MTPLLPRDWRRYWSTSMRLPVAILRDRMRLNQIPKIPKTGIPPINPEKVACFSSPKTDRQLPSFHQQSTTTSPQKHHILPPVFAKTPSKNKVPPPQKITAEAPLFGRGFGFFGGMTTAATFPGLRGRGPWRRPTRANSPTTENAPGMSQNPVPRSFSGEYIVA
jgi:hypothetical protein